MEGKGEKREKKPLWKRLKLLKSLDILLIVAKRGGGKENYSTGERGAHGAALFRGGEFKKGKK
jgi:hypothetical protein